MRTRAVSDPDPQDPKVGSFANFDSWGSKHPGLLDKRPSKRPGKEPKNRFTGPDFENTESNRGSRVLILRIRYSSNSEWRERQQAACITETGGVRGRPPRWICAADRAVGVGFQVFRLSREDQVTQKEERRRQRRRKKGNPDLGNGVKIVEFEN